MKYGKLFLQMLAVLVLSGVLGIVLLCLVFRIPAAPLYQHVKDTAYVFEIEGTWPVRGGREANKLDNYTDALMLTNAVFQKEDASLLDRALRVYFPWNERQTPDQLLRDYVRGEAEYIPGTYSTYWHGYLVFLKPILLFTNYLGIRDINRIVQAALVLAVLAALWIRGQRRLILPFLLSIAYLRPAFLIYSMQYSDIFYLSLCAVLGVLWGDGYLKKGNRYFFYFLILGIITNYVDFLTYPIAALGMPLVTWLALEKDMDWAGKLAHVIGYALSWAAGYFGMWMGKWILAAGILKDFGIIEDALGQAQIRMSSVRDAVPITRSGAVLANIRVGFEGIGMAAGVAAVLVLIYGLWKVRWSIWQFFAGSLPYFAIALMPVAWYLVLANHSWVHAFFTYKALGVSVYAILCAGAAAKPLCAR